MAASPTEAAAPAIELRDVRKHFGALCAVDGIDLRVRAGEILGLIGRNGAGKSTLFKLMLGLEQPTEGEISVAGMPVADPRFRDTRRHIGYLPENIALYDNLSGLETLRFFARLKGAPLHQCDTRLAEAGLSEAANRPVREYSKGMRQRLGIAQALLGSPRLLFFDEPTNGLDPQAIRDFYRRIHALRDGGATIVISSHILAELQQRVDRLAIIADGRLRASGSVAELRSRTTMPVVFVLELAPGDIAAAAAGLAGVESLGITVTDHGLDLACPATQRATVLEAVLRLGPRVRNLQINEPSLEDMFFGLER